MHILYIFPHPDDESFGPGAVMKQQSRQGHAVSLLTLTRGEATKVRLELGLSKEEMASIRSQELADAGGILGVGQQIILDFPDNQLAELDPRELENAVRRTIEALQPNVVVTYPVHGISGFHDHLVTHAVVKRVYTEMREEGHPYLKRLAFITLDATIMGQVDKSKFKLNISPEEKIDCRVELEAEDVQAFHAALDAYRTYQDTINQSGVRKMAGLPVPFEFFQEDHTPPATCLTEGLEVRAVQQA